MKISVMMGGVSSERDVSMRSGRAISSGLKQKGHEVVDAVVSDRSLKSLDGLGPDVVFVALHGEFGEDGELQNMLESRSLPYTGSGPEASRRAMDKLLTKEVFEASGIPCAPHVAFSRGRADVDAIGSALGYPMVVKPAREGSSIGVAVISSPNELPAAVEKALSFGDRGLAESYVKGMELHIGILGTEALPAIWVRPARTFYDYEAKYGNAGTEYICPAPLDDSTTKKVQAAAREAFLALGCRHFARVDMILDERSRPFVLEINTIPGFTETSLLPKAARAAGIGFPDLCDRIARMALEGND